MGYSFYTVALEKVSMEEMIDKIFLIEPLEKKYKKIIVYSDSPENARLAAKHKYHPQIKKSNELIFSDEKLVYLNPNFSICREINPQIISIDSALNAIKIQYEGVEYKIVKNQPIEYIENGLI